MPIKEYFADSYSEVRIKFLDAARMILREHVSEQVQNVAVPTYIGPAGYGGSIYLGRADSENIVRAKQYGR